MSLAARAVAVEQNFHNLNRLLSCREMAAAVRFPLSRCRLGQAVEHDPGTHEGRLKDPRG
jgi:hypothetical protein